MSHTRRYAVLVTLFSVPSIFAAPVLDGEPTLGVESAVLEPNNPTVIERFGYSVDIDGGIAVVGDPRDATLGIPTGAAYVFVRQVTGWSFQQKLLASNASMNDEFGDAVAVDGDTVVIGAPLDSPGFNMTGTAYVFTRTGSTWTEQARLTPSDPNPLAGPTEFGSAVAIDGDTVLVGRYRDDPLGTNSGSAYAFVRTGTTWTQETKFVPSDGAAFRQFGYSLELEGDRALIGGLSFLAPVAGAGYVFQRSGSSWAEEAIIESTDVNSPFDRFGESLSLSGDTAVIGAFGQNSIYTFERSDTGPDWEQVDRLVGPTGIRYGIRIAMDGDVLVSGAPDDSPELQGEGTVFAYRRSERGWALVDELNSRGASAFDGLGFFVALDGCTVVAGAPDLLTSAFKGSTHVFELLDGDPEPGAPACFGVSCPCGNDDPAAGCRNSTGTGATLTAAGTASVAADDLVLVARDAPSSNTGLFILGGTLSVPVAVGDGLVCTGGLFRYLPSQVVTNGDFVLLDPVGGAPPGTITPGATRHFQAWTRDVLCGPPPVPCPSPCMGGSNLSHAYSVTFAP